VKSEKKVSSTCKKQRERGGKKRTFEVSDELLPPLLLADLSGVLHAGSVGARDDGGDGGGDFFAGARGSESGWVTAR
jgi:hypothetical protein